MNFDLLNNGADSFNNVDQCIKKYEKADERFSSYYIKDAIIYLDHAIEILFKYILSKEDKYGIYIEPEKAKKKIEELKEELECKRNDWKEGKHPFIAQKSPFINIYDLDL